MRIAGISVRNAVPGSVNGRGRALARRSPAGAGRQSKVSAVALALLAVTTTSAQQNWDPNVFHWAHIGATGNAPYPGGPTGQNAGTGKVDYEYRISTYEVTTVQWMEFVNTYSTRGEQWKFFADPVFWGAVVDTSYSGPGRKYTLSGSPDAAWQPVGGISWRESAMFVNWLHNRKAKGVWALQDGVYDVSTFTTNANGTFNDQLTHHENAKYWIPTHDEWLKAVHYDPDRYGPGMEGWWTYPHMSEVAPIPGPPGVGQTSGGYTDPVGYSQEYPLGSYPETLTPWGLLDATGAMTEWTEGYLFAGQPTERIADSSAAGWSMSAATLVDRAWSYYSGKPGSTASSNGLRVTTRVVPAHSTGIVMSIALCTMTSSRRRFNEN